MNKDEQLPSSDAPAGTCGDETCVPVMFVREVKEVSYSRQAGR